MLKESEQDARKFTLTSLINKIPVPVAASAVAYYDSLTEKNSPANLLQAMRDYFGAHTFKRLDKKGNFHENW